MLQKLCIFKLLSLYIIYQLIIKVQCLTYNLKGRHGEGYLLDVNIGTPSQSFRVIVDTGSSNFAIAATENQFTNTYFRYQSSSTFRSLNRNVSSKYIQGKWTGELGSDLVSLPTVNNNKITRSPLSLIKKSDSFFKVSSKWNGLLGLAYPKISRPDSSVLSYIDSLQSETRVECLSFSLELCGIFNDTKHFGNFHIMTQCEKSPTIYRAEIVHEWYYQVMVTQISVAGQEVNIPCVDINSNRSIIDSGSTNLAFPPKVFDALAASLYKYSITNNLTLTYEFWDPKETSCFDVAQNWQLLPNISISIAHNATSYFTIDLPGPSYVKQVFSGDSNVLLYCYKLAIEVSETGTILGAIAMEGFNIKFNRHSRSIDFEVSDCGPNVGLRGLFNANCDIIDKCEFKNVPYRNESFFESYILWIFSFTLLLIAASVILFLVLKRKNNNWASHVFVTMSGGPQLIIDDTNTQ